MAILTGINTKMTGSVGDWNFSKVNGRTVVKEKVEPKSTPVRSRKQMEQRMKWQNIVAVWKAFGGTLKPSFESGNSIQSDYNAFMAANLSTEPVYLTKDTVLQGGAVAAPYIVTRGSLFPITTSDNGGVIATDIALGSLTIGTATTVGDFSKAVIANNSDYRNGDQISHYLALQTVDTYGIPRVRVHASAVALNTASDAPLWQAADSRGFTTVEGRIGASAAVEGAQCWVHSRKDNGDTTVSTQRFEVTSTLLAQYCTVSAKEAAIESYGGINTGDGFLPPDDDSNAAVTPGTPP